MPDARPRTRQWRADRLLLVLGGSIEPVRRMARGSTLDLDHALSVARVWLVRVPTSVRY